MLFVPYIAYRNIIDAVSEKNTTYRLGFFS